MSKTIQSLREFRAGRLSVAVIMTGGTIAKSYDPSTARFYNFEPKIKELIEGLRTDDLKFVFYDLMHLDSLDIGDPERSTILNEISRRSELHDAVLVTHGTDGMTSTAEELCSAIGRPAIPVIFTGAMIPYTLRGSDAVQNVTEALLALRLLPPGIYISFHNRVLSVPGVRKNHENLTFEKVG